MCGTLSVPSLALLLTVHLAGGSGNPRMLAVLPETTKQVRVLVRQLDDDDVDVRNRASEALDKFGRLALPVLLDTLRKSPSSEVELRIEKLLPTARVADFNARYLFFVADQKKRYEHDLPGWNELKKATKDTPESRKLFAAILSDGECRNMLVGAFATDTEGRKAFEKRRQDKFLKWLNGWNANTDPNWSVEWNIASLLADLIYVRDYADDIRFMSLRGCLQAKENIDLAVGKGKYGDVPLKFLLRWCAEQKQPHGLYVAMELCPVLKLDESVRLGYLERLLSMPNNPRRGANLDQLATFGGPKTIHAIRKMFDDESDRYNGGILENDGSPRLVQWRDSALAICVALTEQDPKAYGFTVANSKASLRLWSDNYVFHTTKESTAEEKRTAAFRKWAEWEKANPKAIPPDDKKK